MFKTVAISGILSDPSELDNFVIRTLMGQFTCSICMRFRHQARANVKNHVESKHFPNSFTYTCDLCGNITHTKQAHQNHRSKKCSMK